MKLLKRKPDFQIDHTDGTPYMHRWFLIPKNRVFNIYLHHILSSDDDRALHDHRAHNISILLKGSYVESFKDQMIVRKAPCIIFRKATTPHSLELWKNSTGDEVPVWSIFIKGPNYRNWGFHCEKGWVPWEQFVEITENGNKTGKGCD